MLFVYSKEFTGIDPEGISANICKFKFAMDIFVMITFVPYILLITNSSTSFSIYTVGSSFIVVNLSSGSKNV